LAGPLDELVAGHGRGVRGAPVTVPGSGRCPSRCRSAGYEGLPIRPCPARPRPGQPGPDRAVTEAGDRQDPGDAAAEERLVRLGQVADAEPALLGREADPLTPSHAPR